MNGERIIRTLRSLKLDGWSILVQTQQRSTLHITANEEIETGIGSERRQAEVVVYRRFGEEQGDARFTLFTDEPSAVKRKVAEALAICATARKPAWPLPGKQRYARVETADPVISAAFEQGTAERLNLRLWARIRAAARKERGVRLCHAELHLTRTRNLIANSAGVRGQSEATVLFAEAILTARKGKEENEFLEAITVGRVADFSPERFIAETARQARDVLRAEPFRKVQEKGIILSGTALRDFWAPDLTNNALLFHASAQSKYRNLSQQETGKVLTWNAGFTLRSNPFLPFNPASGRFDNEGTASKAVTIVERGICQEFLASQRYASYIGVEPTGALGPIEIDAGEERGDAMRTEGAVEIVGFSSFVPNSMSGDFSAEIRLGYLHRRGRRIPIRGAMFSGNIFRMLDLLRLSRERMAMDRYHGPAVMRFESGCHLAGF